MKQQGKFILLTLDEFTQWLAKKQVTRQIKVLQVHHTWGPSYKDFNGQNHFALLSGMENYQVKEEHFSEIAQNLTTFPDGLIAIGRDLNTAPAGIKGCNSNGICIENVGNFDAGHDQMTPAHRATILGLYAELCQKFNLQPNTDTIQYHHWWDLDTGQRTNGTGDVKTCPGTNWFGGNSVQIAQTNFIPLIVAELNKLKGAA